MLGIIASSGARKLGERLGLAPHTVDTPWGAAQVRLGVLAGREVACLARHTEGKVAPPHRVNYRANVAALAAVGCTGVLATNAVGSLCTEFGPLALCLPDQILDFTRGRPLTFSEDEIVAVDFTQPYCARLQRVVEAAAETSGLRIHSDLVYACTEGPRFETAAEIRMLQTLGAHLVGMTAMPEAALAREKGLCYASLCVVTNLAAGVAGHHPSGVEVTETMERSWHSVGKILSAVAAGYADDPDCPCRGGAAGRV